MSFYWNNAHIYNWISFAYFESARYKSAKYIVYWYDTVSTNIIKFFTPNFYITTFSNIVNLTVKSRLIVPSWHKPFYISQSMCQFLSQ